MPGEPPMDWDQTYESGEYLNHWDYRFPSQELVAAIAALGIAPGGSALDIGCGAGREAIFLSRCGLKTIGIDVSAKAIAVARERARAEAAEVEWREGSALKLPVDDRSIDFANDRGCFHHIEDADRGRYAQEVARVLKPGGWLLLRGASEAGEEGFVPVTEASTDRHFSRPEFTRGLVLPITMISDAGTLAGSLVVLRSK